MDSSYGNTMIFQILENGDLAHTRTHTKMGKDQTKNEGHCGRLTGEVICQYWENKIWNKMT